MVVTFVVLGGAVDSYLHDHSITFHYKIVAGAMGAGLVLLMARQAKGIFLREPIRS